MRQFTWAIVSLFTAFGCGVGVTEDIVGENDGEGDGALQGEDVSGYEDALVSTTLATDNFDRANSSSLGSNWEAGYGGRIGFQVSAGKLAVSAANPHSLNTYKGVSTPSSQWAEISIGAYDRDTTFPGVVLRFTAPPTFSGYECRLRNGGETKARIAKWVNGTISILATNSSVSWAVGDKIRCEAQGSKIQMFQVRGATKTLVVQITDATFSSGRTGVMSLGASAQLDNFSVGTLAEPAPPLSQTGRAFYLSPSGNDSNPGTLAQPWKTLDRLQDAQSSLKPGDTVYFRGGDYVVNDSTRRDSYVWKAQATATAPVTYKNYPGEKPVIVGDRRTRAPGTLIYLQNYQTLDGLTFRETDAQRLAGGHGDNPNARSGLNRWTPLSTWATGVTIRNVTIQGWSLGMFYKGDGLLFEKNQVTNTRSHRLYISGKNGVFRNNILGGNNGYFNQQGFQVQYKSAVGNKLHGNVIYEGKATGFVLSGGVSKNEIFNNIFINPGNKAASISGPGTAIGLWCEDGPIGDGNKIYNNTFMGFIKSTLIADPLTAKCNGVRPVSRVEIRDNIFAPTGNVRVGLTQSYPNIRNNIMSNVSGTMPTGNSSADPLLVNRSGTTPASAKLKAGSPAIDQGKSSVFPRTDFAGQARPRGTAYDIGAFEY